jgi:hypothetical protein
VAARHNEQVLRWRRDVFAGQGFDEVMAALLAHSNIDTHQMGDLIRAGCPPEVASRILMGTDFQGDDPHWKYN